MLSACEAPPLPIATVPAGQVMPASDFAADARLSRDKQLPIMVVVTRHDCPYCMRIKQEVLRPMLLSGDYAKRVIIRELMIDPAYQLNDFAGQAVISLELAQRYEAIFTPTVLLLDASGKELAERLLGINTTELYGYYLDQAIDEALARLRSDHAGNAG